MEAHLEDSGEQDVRHVGVDDLQLRRRRLLVVFEKFGEHWNHLRRHSGTGKLRITMEKLKKH